jgi:hypothetical protein
MCRNTATFVKTLFTDPVNSETTVYREREKVKLIWCSFLSHSNPLFIKIWDCKVGRFQSEKTKIPLKFIQFTKIALGFWLNYLNTLELLANLPKYPFEVGMGFFMGLFRLFRF